MDLESERFDQGLFFKTQSTGEKTNLISCDGYIFNKNTGLWAVSMRTPLAISCIELSVFVKEEENLHSVQRAK